MDAGERRRDSRHHRWRRRGLHQARPPIRAACTAPGPGHRAKRPAQGTWQVADGSLAGFRIEETALGLGNYVGGQTRAVNGVIAISGNTVTSAQFRINLTTVKVSGRTQTQLATSLGTRDHPVAVFTLTEPVALSRAFPPDAPSPEQRQGTWR